MQALTPPQGNDPLTRQKLQDEIFPNILEIREKKLYHNNVNNNFTYKIGGI